MSVQFSLSYIVKRTTIILVFFAGTLFSLNAQAVYVDCNQGNDTNTGTKDAPLYSINKAAEIINASDNNIYTMKINPGIYVLDTLVNVTTNKNINNHRFVIEASILPDDSSWTPEKMPVIINSSNKGEVPGKNFHYVVSFLVNSNNVTFRGLKFPGYFYPNTRYFPIARFNKEKNDLYVEQCLFVGDDDANHLQVGIIAHGNKVRIDHCVFYGARNSVVFYLDTDGKGKTGNGITNSIICGASQSAVWTDWPDNDFVFRNNIVSDCKHFWIKNAFNDSRYSIENCVVVNNEHYLAVADTSGVIPHEFDISEINVVKKGDIQLRKKEPNTDAALPKDYLHVIPGTAGSNIKAGLFKN